MVAETVEETARVRTIVLDVPDWSGHRAGQHLDLRLTAEDGYHAEREYSIASAPGEPVAITVERLDEGEVSPYLTEKLRTGTHSNSGGRWVPTSCGIPLRTAVVHFFSSAEAPESCRSGRC